MRLLFVGDIVGKPGRRAFAQLVPGLRQEFKIDVVVANTENLAHGKSVTSATLQDVFTTGLDIGTGGNHTFDKPAASEIYRAGNLPLVRPLNLPVELPGEGIKTFTVSQKRITVINLMGEYAMPFPPAESPFKAMERLLADGLPTADATIVDLHALATSEKVGMGWYLDGQVSAVIGTDTHIPTADARILPKGTAYVTDVGMVGLRDSSLGVDWHGAVERFLHDTRAPFEIPDHGLVELQAVLIDITDGRGTKIERVIRQIEV